MAIGGDEWSGVVLVVHGHGELPICRIDGWDRFDLGVVDALARLQLALGQLGLSIRLRNPTRELRELLDLAGLTDLFPDSER